MSEPLPPIPTPTGNRLKELNFAYTPILAFIVVTILALFLWNQRLGPLTLQGEAETIEYHVSSSVPGTVAEAPKPIRSFQKVASGEIVARLVGPDPKNPIALTSPLEGVVTKISKIPGEIVAAGEPILTISAPQPDRIIGFLRQPMIIEPKEGMVVEVRPRARIKGTFESRIEKIAPQLAPIRGSLLPVGQTRLELGLPIIIAMPDKLKLYPGEIVDLTIHPDRTMKK